jgi:superfamily I DNA/RNA helicase
MSWLVKRWFPVDVKIVFGPPGTGKTHKLMEYLEKELHDYEPEDIAYVSYTKEGSNQGKERAKGTFGFANSRFPYFQTLHSMAFKALKLRRSDVLGKKDYKAFSDKLGMKFTGYYTEDLRHDDDMYLFFIDLHRNNPKAAKTYLSLLQMDKLKFVESNYLKYKEYFGKIDYTDMIMQFNQRNKATPVKVAFIDEAQDLTTLQWQMVWTAFKDCDKVYIAGDDDQAIYQWSGADVDYFLNLEGDMEVLSHSYRVPNNLLYLPQSITGMMGKRIEKKYDGISKEGTVSYLNSPMEAPIKNGESWLILSRNNYFLTEVEDAMRERGMLYIKKGTPSITKEKIEIIKLFTKVSRSKMMSQQEEIRLSNNLKDGYDLNKPWYDNVKWPMKEIIYYRDVIANKTINDKVTIKIGTIHSAKGDEAENVLLLMDVTKSVKKNLELSPDSEHRCFYVGVTRTSKNLYIVNPRTKYSYPLFIGGKDHGERKEG